MEEIGFAGIHHVTAIAGDPRANVDFYAGLLGLRLVKKTVNFDDPGTYHLYYGDGTPGTIMIFFPWEGAPRGRIGAGQVITTSYSIPETSLGYWTERLVENGLRFEKPQDRFGDTVLAFKTRTACGWRSLRPTTAARATLAAPSPPSTPSAASTTLPSPFATPKRPRS